MFQSFVAAGLVFLALATAPTPTPLPTSGPKYCAALNSFVVSVLEVEPSVPGVYQSALFMASIATANGLDPTVKQTHAQVVKAAQDSEDCYPTKTI